MNEILGMIYGFARAAWRRRWIAVATAWAVALVAWFLVLQMPDKYEASARIFVDARTALRPVLEGIAIDTDYDSQLALVREQLRSRPLLEAVARETNLHTAEMTPASIDGVVSALQGEIQLTSASSGGSDTLYTISYRDTDRAKSVQVVDVLLKKFVKGTESGNESGQAETQEFLDARIAEVEVQLQAAEKRVAEFKKRYVGQIPGEKGDYFTRYDLEQSGLQQAETDLAISYGERAELRKQLANARAFLPGTSSSAGVPAGATPDITQRRQAAEQQYEDLMLRFTDQHPEAKALRATIDNLKRLEAEEMAELQRGGAGTGAIRSLAANPLYQQIQSQLNQIEVQIAKHQSAARQHKDELAKLSRFVDRAPEIQQEYLSLNRDYDAVRTQYDLLVTKRQQARVSDDATKAGAVRFEVIDPPRAADTPVSPRRELLFIVVLFLAIGAGIGLAILPQLFSPTFDDVATLQRKAGLPVLGAVSVIRSAEQRGMQNREILKVTFAAGLLVAFAAVLSVAGSAGARMLRVLIT